MIDLTDNECAAYKAYADHADAAEAIVGLAQALAETCEPDEEIWARDLDGTGSMHMCTPHCSGAVRYIREDLI